ncbi:MAG: YraN family protein [Candidatus Moranbacteria bacterium]|nr:YraN family protein [Candidatus Moranbacteria bacterium]
MTRKKVKSKNNLKIGQKGELKAVKYLQKSGYKILDRNWFNKKGVQMGELDIVAKDENDNIIFVEVKSRRANSLKIGNKIFPEEQITARKMSKLQKIAEYYIEQNNLWESDWRFDAVSVVFYLNDEKPKIKHFENIFL